MLLKNPPTIFSENFTKMSLLRNFKNILIKEINKNLNKISQGKTTLIIAHRLSSVSNADKIIVIDKGNIIEEGDHLSLLKKNGLYALMWNKQKHEINN